MAFTRVNVLGLKIKGAPTQSKCMVVGDARDVANFHAFGTPRESVWVLFVMKLCVCRVKLTGVTFGSVFASVPEQQHQLRASRVAAKAVRQVL